MDANAQPTPEPTPAPALSRTTIDIFRTNRETVAYVLLGLSVVFLILTIWLAYRGFRTPEIKPESKPTEKTDQKTAPGELPKLETPAEAVNIGKGDYLVGGLATLVGFLVTAAAGVWMSVGIPAPTEERQRTEARITLLTIGGLLGLTLMVLGAWYFYSWSASLTAWLDKGQVKEARWVVIPLLMIATGAGVVLAAVQPARAEERNNPGIRRLVYGTNLGVGVILLLAVLVAGNVIIAMRVPNQLDVTQSAVAVLDDTTREYLKTMDQPVQVLVIMPEGSTLTSDIRRLLDRMKEAAPPNMLTVRSISPTTDKEELTRLVKRFPVLVNNLGVLLTTGAEEPGQRHVLIRVEDLTGTEGGGPGQQPREVFRGQGRILRELKFLAEGGQKPVLYFTQGAGELSVNPDPRGDRTASAGLLRDFLERNYLDVRVLPTDATPPRVPDDAAAVVVLNPQKPLTKPVVDALEEYVVKRKGRLLVLAGATPSTEALGFPIGGGRYLRVPKVAPTGLEPLLAKLGVELATQVLSGVVERGRDIQMSEMAPVPAPAAIEARNSLAIQFPRGLRPWEACRPVTPQQATVPGYQATALFVTAPGRDTWQAPVLVPPDVLYETLQAFPRARQQFAYQDKSRPIAATISDGSSPRVVVIGCGDMVSDVPVRDQIGGGRASGPALDGLALISASIDWLRERKSIGADKPYGMYSIDPATDPIRLIVLPIGLTFVAILGLGLGIWVIRRQ